MTRVAYLVHNLGDAAVHRRIAMLAQAGASVQLAGFLRAGDKAPESVPSLPLGVTHDAALAQRAVTVLRNLARPRVVLDTCRGADVIVARNLEMLALGAMAKRRLGVPRLVYECLDIHRVMLGNTAKNAVMRSIERRLIHAVDLVVHSSPAFRREYFEPIQHVATPMMLLENKLPATAPRAPAENLPISPPWRIAWFGNLRCIRTMSILQQLARASAGRIEVVIAGKPSPSEFPDFENAVKCPGVTYVGPYRPEDLPALYARCHFAWAIDFFEESLNSSWLLPNRIYEASAHGCVPIALASVETGRWLHARGAGLLLSDAHDLDSVRSRITTLQPGAYAALTAAVRNIPASDLFFSEAENAAVLQCLLGEHGNA